MATTTRSSTEVWLIGQSTETLSTARLSSKGDVLRKFYFHHLDENQGVKKSIRLTIEAVLMIWQRARIPTQRIDHAERKLQKLIDEYFLLKKNKVTELDSIRVKQELFKADLDDLFDISSKDALQTMTNEEDKTFLSMQREDTMSCSMAGVDKCLTKKENRKRERGIKAEKRRLRSMVNNEPVPSTSGLQDDVIGASSSSAPSSSDDEFEMPSSSSCTSTSTKKKKKVLTEDVISTVDRVNLSDRKTLFVLGAVAQALGHPVTEMSLSRSTIRRKRREIRAAVTTRDQASFSTQDPLLLHWDSKLLPDIAGGKHKVDRVAIIVTGGGMEKLLAVPEVRSGTGQEQANACLRTLEDWKLKTHVRGLVFDTTASNTGLKSGACILLDKALQKNLVWIACRHHVFEVMLSDVFGVVFGPSGGPDVKLFTRFQQHWPQINKKTFTSGSDDLFNTAYIIKLREELTKYYSDAMKTQQPRDDYLELLNLCRIFLGGASSTESGTNFRVPGAVHRARWMAKAIYSLKIYMFQEQFVLTAKEKKGITDFCLFVSLIYGRYWNEAPLAERAPLNDVKLLTEIQAYPNQVIRDAAAKAFRRHLWYLSEHLVGLALFDPRVEATIKKEMVKNLQHPAMEKNLKRLDGATFNYLSPLDTYVTKRTTEFFDLLANNGQERAVSFLDKDPAEWTEDATYIEMLQKVRKMKVVNDCAERGIALVQEFNTSITKDEEQKQYLLRLVDLHRKQFPVASKTAVMKMTVAQV